MFKFNKVISTFMEFYNKHKNVKIHTQTAFEIKKAIACFAPKKFFEKNL